MACDKVNIGSGNGLLPNNIKPLPEPMLTNHQWDIHLGALSQEMLMILILDMNLKITNLTLQPCLPGANELSGMWCMVEICFLGN